MFRIKSDHGYLFGYDGEDYRWTRDVTRAWKMPRRDMLLHLNRLEAAKVPNVEPELIELERY